MSKRDDYVDTLKAQLDQWNADIAKWEVRSHEVQAEARTEYDKRMETLRQQREQALYQLRLLQSAAGDAWLDLMKGTDAVMSSRYSTLSAARMSSPFSVLELPSPASDFDHWSPPIPMWRWMRQTAAPRRARETRGTTRSRAGSSCRRGSRRRRRSRQASITRLSYPRRHSRTPKGFSGAPTHNWMSFSKRTGGVVALLAVLILGLPSASASAACSAADATA